MDDLTENEKKSIFLKIVICAVILLAIIIYALVKILK